jgi:hypothetical protein
MAVLAGQPVDAQQRVVPEGTVITVRSETLLDSEDARAGDRFVTSVVRPLRVDGLTVIPAGSRVEGTVDLARRATSRQSGLIGVAFTRLVLPNGNTFGIDGRLTSTDPEERAQIEAQGGSRVVFVGGRTGVGAAIGSIGAGDPDDPVSGFLGALGTLLSRGADVTVPVNTVLAVELGSAIALTATGAAAPGTDPTSIYTSAEMIRAAQQALRARNYYRGPLDGRLTVETRRALFEFQIDHEVYPTGNLDGETAAELGLGVGGVVTGLTPAAASVLRRNAQTLVGTWRDMIGVTPAGRFDPRRSYRTAELELYFALSGFADNASLYDQMVRVSTNTAGISAAGQALIASARRVDAALQRIATPQRLVTGWRSIQNDLRPLDARYPR